MKCAIITVKFTSTTNLRSKQSAKVIKCPRKVSPQVLKSIRSKPQQSLCFNFVLGAVNTAEILQVFSVVRLFWRLRFIYWQQKRTFICTTSVKQKFSRVYSTVHFYVHCLKTCLRKPRSDFELYINTVQHCVTCSMWLLLDFGE